MLFVPRLQEDEAAALIAPSWLALAHYQQPMDGIILGL